MPRLFAVARVPGTVSPLSDDMHPVRCDGTSSEQTVRASPLVCEDDHFVATEAGELPDPPREITRITAAIPATTALALARIRRFVRRTPGLTEGSGPSVGDT